MSFTHTFISRDGWGQRRGGGAGETGTVRQIWTFSTAGGVAQNVFISHNATHYVISHHALCQLPLPPPLLAAQPRGGASGGGAANPAGFSAMDPGHESARPRTRRAPLRQKQMNTTAAQVHWKRQNAKYNRGGQDTKTKTAALNKKAYFLVLCFIKYNISSVCVHALLKTILMSLWLDAYFRRHFQSHRPVRSSRFP